MNQVGREGDRVVNKYIRTVFQRAGVVGGLLVGFGSRLGSGCTSGHGVCGIARLSIRSLLATALFTGAAIATVFIIRHLI